VTRAHKGWALDTVTIHNEVLRQTKEEIITPPAVGAVGGAEGETFSLRARDVSAVSSQTGAPWARPWVQSPVPQKQNKSKQTKLKTGLGSLSEACLLFRELFLCCNWTVTRPKPPLAAEWEVSDKG
jgi:hypothetical protein